MTRIFWYLAVIAALAWTLLLLFDRYQMFSGVALLRPSLFTFALAISGIAAVGIVGRFISVVLLRLVFGVEITGITLAAIYIILSFSIGALALRILGFDIVTIVTTSAIIGALVGFSMQTTIGSMISGVAMSSERLFVEGAGLEIDGELLTIQQKLWRHIVAARHDGVRVVVPNQIMADSIVRIYPVGAPVQFSVHLSAPPNVPPQELTVLLADAFADMVQIDSTKPVEIAPTGITTEEQDNFDYEIRLFARDFGKIGKLRGEVLRRCWYILQRNGFIDVPMGQQALRDLITTASPGMEPSKVAHVTKTGIVYRFAPSEILNFPANTEGQICLVLRGQARIEDDMYLNPLPRLELSSGFVDSLPVEELSKMARLRKIADRLAEEIGPVAESAIHDAVRSCRSFDALIRQVSVFIDDTDHRERFLNELSGLSEKKGQRGPGAIVPLVGDAIDRVMTDPEMRAVSEVTTIVYPEMDSRG